MPDFASEPSDESDFNSIFDFTTASTAVVFQDKPVVYRSSWLIRALSAAQEAGKNFVVLTPNDAALTLPMSELLSRPGCQWLATTTDGCFFDGTSGRIISWDGEDFTPTDRLADDFLLTSPAPSGMIHVRAGTVHPASVSARIGDLAEQVFRELTGGAPLGWGVHEPASEPWDVAAVTGYCYDGAPATAALVVVGHPRPGTDAPTIATLTVERTSTGVQESLELLAETPDPLSERELESFAATMHRAHARTALLGHALGYIKLARPARFTGMSVPGCAIFGPEVIKGAGADRALALAGPNARLHGAAPFQSLAVTYAQEPIPGQLHPLEEYMQLVARLEGAKL